MIHRDIKPENILEKNDRIKIAGFDSIKMASNLASLSENQDSLVGTE